MAGLGWHTQSHSRPVLHLRWHLQARRCAAVLFRAASGEHDFVRLHDAALDDPHPWSRRRGLAWNVLSAGGTKARARLTILFHTILCATALLTDRSVRATQANPHHPPVLRLAAWPAPAFLRSFS